MINSPVSGVLQEAVRVLFAECEEILLAQPAR
jgi:hypothetical protein